MCWQTEGALTFVPIKSALNVAQISIMSMLFFGTLDAMEDWQAVRYVVGLVTVVVGVLLILLRPQPRGTKGESPKPADDDYR
jgi:hypothetical protein